jgi:hypothetical protein
MNGAATLPVARSTLACPSRRTRGQRPHLFRPRVACLHSGWSGARSAPKGAIHVSPCRATLYEIGYEYDAVGNRTRLTSTAARAHSTDADTQALFHLDEPADATVVLDSSGKGLVGDLFGNVALGADGRFSTARSSRTENRSRDRRKRKPPDASSTPVDGGSRP